MWGRTQPERIRFIGLAVAVFWLVIAAVAVIVLGIADSWLGIIAAVALPFFLILIATFAASTAARLRGESGDLRQELDAMRAQAASRDAPPIRPGTPVAAEAHPSGPVPNATAALDPQGDAEATGGNLSDDASDEQPELALDPMPRQHPPLEAAELIRALNFPEDAEDTEGFRALRLALQDHHTALLVQAAQDVLTLLSQDGIYMDDLKPDRARPELWRRFARGERGGQVSMVGGIRDRSSLALCATRMREDPVFRDAAHHFLRRFDRLLAGSEEAIDDEAMVRLTDTRTARAFMLVGRVSGLFD